VFFNTPLGHPDRFLAGATCPPFAPAHQRHARAWVTLPLCSGSNCSLDKEQPGLASPRCEDRDYTKPAGPVNGPIGFFHFQDSGGVNIAGTERPSDGFRRLTLTGSLHRPGAPVKPNLSRIFPSRHAGPIDPPHASTSCTRPGETVFSTISPILVRDIQAPGLLLVAENACLPAASAPYNRPFAAPAGFATAGWT